MVVENNTIYNANASVGGIMCGAPMKLAEFKDKCGYEKIPEAVDLQKEGGGMVDLHSLGRSYAKEALEPAATYILCKLVEPEGGGTPTPEMLWTPPEGYAPPAASKAPAGKKK